MNQNNAAKQILASGATVIIAAGTVVPLCNGYSVGTVTLTAGSLAVTSAGGADFSDAHAVQAAAHVLYLKSLAGYVYKVQSVSAAANTLVLEVPAIATEVGVVYTLYSMYDSSVMLLSCCSGNTGGVWVGNSAVKGSTRIGIYVPKADFLILPASSACDFWVDSDFDGDVLSWVLLV